jgi:hypothetical protein
VESKGFCILRMVVLWLWALCITVERIYGMTGMISRNKDLAPLVLSGRWA